MVLLGFRSTIFALLGLPCLATLGLSAAQIPSTAAAQTTSPRAADSPELSAALARSFPEADSFPTRVATLSEDQQRSLAALLRGRKAPRLWTYREARKQGVLLGRAVEGDVQGKLLPITYLVVFSLEHKVRSVEVLNYRESHGGEVRREKWRAQFHGLGAGDAVRLGTDIKNIAGATISCRALTDGVHDALAIAELVFTTAVDTPTPTRGVAAAPRTDETGETVQRRTQLLMGTLLELRAVTDDRARFDAAADAAFARVAELESLWSTWRSDSEVSCLNAAEPGAWCALSSPTITLLARARDLCGASGAAFATEIGPLVKLWRAAELLQCEPTSAEIAAARTASASEAFELDIGQCRARRRSSGACLDLGAIGKGAALDEVAQEFRSRELRRALFDFGGQLLALDGPRAGAGWPVCVRDPRPGASAALWELELESASLATSADDQRGLWIGGRRRSHIVDPRSGLPAELVWTACALASNGTDADAWSTATFVLGHAAGSALAAQNGVRVLSLDLEGTIATSAGFPGHGTKP